MKKLLSISILAVMLILTSYTGVNATTNDTLADELYSLLSTYGFTSSDKVRVERYLSSYPVTDSEAEEIMTIANNAVTVFTNAGVTNYAELTSDQKAELKTMVTEVADIIDVTLVWTTDTVYVYKDGTLIEAVTETNGKLSYTGNSSNMILVVSSIAVIALASAVVARKKFANA